MADSLSYEDAVGGGQSLSYDEAVKRRPISQLGALGSGLAQGATANFADELAGAVSAGTAKTGIPKSALLAHPAFPAAAALTGLGRMGYEAAAPYLGLSPSGDATKAYGETSKAVSDYHKAAKEQHPWTAGGGELAGALLTPLPMAKGRGLLEATKMGAVAGAGYGTAAGIGGGETASERVTGGLFGAPVGGLLGGLGPSVVKGAGYVGSKIGDMLGNPIKTARGMLHPDETAALRAGEALQKDITAGKAGLTADEVLEAQARGQPVRAAEMGGENVMELAKSAGVISPTARDLIRDETQGAFRSQGIRAANYMRNLFGSSLDTGERQAALKVARDKENAGTYGRAFASPRGQGMWNEFFEHIAQDPQVQSAMERATTTGRTRATAEGFRPFKNPFVKTEEGGMVLKDQNVTPNIQFWDEVRRNLDDTVSKLYRQGETNQAGPLRAIKDELRSYLGHLVPEYDAAVSGAAKHFRARDALEAGEKFLTDTKMSFGEAAAQARKFSPADRQLFAEGFAGNLVRQFEASNYNLNLLNKSFLNNPAAKRRIDLALGPQRSNELETYMRVEGIMNRLKNTLGGSDTAQKLTHLGLATAGGGGYGTYTGDWKDAGAIFAALVSRPAMRHFDQKVATKIAEMLVSHDPDVFAKGVKLAARNQGFKDSLRSISEGSIERALAQQAPRSSAVLPAMQGPIPGRAEENRPQ